LIWIESKVTVTHGFFENTDMQENVDKKGIVNYQISGRKQIINYSKSCHIIGLKARNKDKIDMCIAFMHEKSGKFHAFV
jgi:hypothetical protein